jgi:hypothetical protein
VSEMLFYTLLQAATKSNQTLPSDPNWKTSRPHVTHPKTHQL